MKHTKTLALTIVSIGAASGALLGVSGSSAQQPSARTVTVTDSRNGARFAFIDNPPSTRLTRQGDPRRISIGDEIVFVNRLRTTSGGKGRGYFRCVAVAAAAGAAGRFDSLCIIDMALPDGHLVGSGRTANLYGNRIEIPVTGGTGAYAGARGTLRRLEGPPKMNGGTDTISLLP